MFRRPPEAKRSDTLFPCPPLVRSAHPVAQEAVGLRGPRGLVGAAVVDAWMPGAADEGFHRARLLPGKKRPRAARPRPWGFEESGGRSEEHTSELQSLMRISYAVFCLKKKKKQKKTRYNKKKN